MINEELEDYRSWLRLVDCGQESLSGRYSPLVAVKARVTDVVERMTFAVPGESFVWRWCYNSVWCCSHCCDSLWWHVLLGNAELAICGAFSG